MEKIIKVHLTRYAGNHPVASVSPDRVFEIAEMENAVVVNVNKQAKRPYGEGPQISVSAGDLLSREQAIQIADNYETTLVAITESEQSSGSLLKG